MNSIELKEHITSTYVSLRIGIALLALFLPFLLWIGGHIFAGLPLQQSMSAYYHAGSGAMRDVFVGVLITVGFFIFLYRGFTTFENQALNLAGLLLVGVAIFPMEWDCGSSCSRFSLHGTFAVLFFFSVAYVCIFRASDTLGLISDETEIARYKKTYRLLGVGMVIAPAIAVILTLLLQPHSEVRSTVFFVELFCVLIFASYWIVKSREIARSNCEQDACEGKLSTHQYQAADMFNQISVVRAPRPMGEAGSSVD